MSIDLSSTYGSIHSSITPVTTSTHGVERILISDNLIGWSYSTTSGVITFPIWAIIDLGQERPITGFTLYGLSYDTGGAGCPKSYVIEVASGLVASPQDSDFSWVWSSSLPIPPYPPQGKVWVNSEISAITPQFARYVKISVNSSQADTLTALGIGAFQIWGEASLEESSTMVSQTRFTNNLLATVTSDAHIYIYKPIYIDKKTINSDAEFSDTLHEVSSNALIEDIGIRINSDAIISNTETHTILSDSSFSRIHLDTRNVYAALPGSGSLTVLPEYSITALMRNVLVYTDLDSTSDEVIAADMFTSTPIDLENVSPPLNYQNFDWSYDWVVRTYNKAQYKFEVRTGATLTELGAAVFSEISLGASLSRYYIPRYHQWRLHTWASGSNDLEMHQFTIKGHVNQASTQLYRSLIDPPFTTTGVINLEDTKSWEPDLGTADIWTEDYIPGDWNGDGIVDGDDYLYGVAYLSGGPAPVDARTADINGTGDTALTIGDVAYIYSYLYEDGAPPKAYRSSL